MRIGSRLSYLVEWAHYEAKYIALMIWGPATQDRAVDPIENLKREHGRPTSP